MGVWPRQSGPYGYHRSITSKYDPSYLTPGGSESVDAYDELLQELYRNHNFDVDNHNSEEAEEEENNNTASTDHSTGSGDFQRKNNNGFYGQSNRGFNGELDSIEFFNGMDQPGGSGASQGWRQDQGHPLNIRRKAGVWGDAGTHWRNTMRSDAGYGVAAGHKLPIDVYSILSLVLFTVFLSYLIYHYITTLGAEDNARSLGLPRSDKILWVLKDVTRALERWVVFEALPQDQIPDEDDDEEEEEEEEKREKLAKLVDG
ncbi:uncharacterized protein [Panulirus ornatus]|uniref:uncharacterized protein n=1 Tax=Panulirus ornatus TaxID=150431 RepID=UPI003A8488C9